MIIALGYRKESGKDTVANMLVEGYGYSKIGISYRLKKFFVESFGLTWDDVETPTGKMRYNNDFQCTNREALQKIGHGFRKYFGDDIWLRFLSQRLRQGGKLVIPDLRYKNEFEFVKKLGGKCVRIDRKAAPRSLHITENQLVLVPDDQWDYIIDNNGSFDHLHLVVEEMLEKFEGGE